MKTNIRVEKLDAMTLAYVSHQGGFSKIGNAYGSLMNWAGQNGLLGKPNSKTVTIYHDNPKEVGEENVRQSACLKLDARVETSQGVEIRQTTAGEYVVGSFEIGFENFERAWEDVVKWISENGKNHNEGDCFEIFHNNFMEHPEKKCIVDICIPVQ